MAATLISGDDFLTALNAYEKTGDVKHWKGFQQKIHHAGTRDLDHSYYEAAIDIIAGLKDSSRWRFVNDMISDRICDRCPPDLVPALRDGIVANVFKNKFLTTKDKIEGIHILTNLLCCYPELIDRNVISAFDERGRLGSALEQGAIYQAIAKIVAEPKTPKKVIPFDMALRIHDVAKKSGLRSVRYDAQNADVAICASDPAYKRYFRREIPKRVAEPLLRVLRRHICALN